MTNTPCLLIIVSFVLINRRGANLLHYDNEGRKPNSSNENEFKGGTEGDKNNCDDQVE